MITHSYIELLYDKPGTLGKYEVVEDKKFGKPVPLSEIRAKRFSMIHYHKETFV